MDQEQRKYLQNLLRETINDKESYTRPPRPQRVRDAEKIIERWQRMHSSKSYRLRTRVQKIAGKIRELILFGDAQKALKAIKEFQARKFT